MIDRRDFLMALGAGFGVTGLGKGDGATAAPAVAPPFPKAAISNRAASWVQTGRAAGLAVAIAVGGQVVFREAFGFASLKDKAPVTPRTIFRVGSIQKQFTATAILLLAQEGRLALDDRVARWFPHFPRAGEVTIRQLLTHTSGLHNYTDVRSKLGFLEFLRDHTTLDWVGHIAAQRPLYDFDPGTAWHYSNSGFYVAGAIAEQIARRPLGAFLQARVFAPTGMADTAMDQNPWTLDGLLGHPPDDSGRRARGYDVSEKHPGAYSPSQYVSMTVAGPAGALRSTADDLVRWHLALFGGRLLDSAGLRAMTTPARLKDGRLTSKGRVDAAADPPGEYGLGLRLGTLGEHRLIGHEGDIPGFNAVINTYPDDRLTIAVLANTSGGALQLERRVAQLALARSAGSR
jgi:CubicO group peptidase (beta-lactamase class C family)